MLRLRRGLATCKRVRCCTRAFISIKRDSIELSPRLIGSFFNSLLRLDLSVAPTSPPPFNLYTGLATLPIKLLAEVLAWS